jgi:hypothetical protein
MPEPHVVVRSNEDGPLPGSDHHDLQVDAERLPHPLRRRRPAFAVRSAAVTQAGPSHPAARSGARTAQGRGSAPLAAYRPEPRQPRSTAGPSRRRASRVGRPRVPGDDRRRHAVRRQSKGSGRAGRTAADHEYVARQFDGHGVRLAGFTSAVFLASPEPSRRVATTSRRVGRCRSVLDGVARGGGVGDGGRTRGWRCPSMSVRRRPSAACGGGRTRQLGCRSASLGSAGLGRWSLGVARR